jgi:hypothetical protein
VIFLSQWFIMLCLLEYCISIIKKSDIFVTVIYHAMSLSMSLSVSLSNMKYGEKPWQIPYPMENWKMRFMVVCIQNHDKFIVLIWKTLGMRFGCKIRINSLHSVQLSYYGNYQVNKIHIWIGFTSPDMNFIDPIFSVLGQLCTV